MDQKKENSNYSYGRTLISSLRGWNHRHEHENKEKQTNKQTKN